MKQQWRFLNFNYHLLLEFLLNYVRINFEDFFKK